MRLILEEDDDLTLYKALRAFIRGKIDSDELEGADRYLYRIHPETNLAQSKLWFEFNNDETLFQLLDLSDDDGWFARAVVSRYDNFDIESYDSVWDDFIQGYGSVFYSMNEENTEKIKKIGQILIGREINFSSETDMSSLAKAMDKLFPSETNNILDYYHYYLNREIQDSAKESIEKELNEFLNEMGFNLYRKFDIIETTPANLLMWYLKLNVKDLNFEELFEAIVKSIQKNERGHSRIGGWYDNQYEFRDSANFDDLGYNREVEKNLDRIEYEMEENEEYSAKIALYKEIFNLGYSIDEWRELPKNKKYKFRIKNVDTEKGKIKVELTKNPYDYHTKVAHREVDLEGFKLLLNHPELFKLEENVIKKF